MIDLNLPYLTDEHKSLAMLVKEFCEREVDLKKLNEIADQPISPNATPEELRKRIPVDLMSKAQDAGLRQLCIPKEFGGSGYENDHIAQGIAAEVAGYYGGQFGRLMTINWKQQVGIAYLQKDLQEEIYSDFLRDKSTMLAASITEPNHGSDYLVPYEEPGLMPDCVAVKDGDEWVINGDKMFCTAGGVSNYVHVTIKTDLKAPVTKGMTQFIVPTRTKGWSISRVNVMMGNEIAPNVQMRFENVRIPDRYRVSPVNGAFEIMRSRLAGKSLHMFGQFLGWSERVFDDMKEYAKARIQGGRPIIQHPNVGAMIAEADCLLKSLRLLLYQNAWECMGIVSRKELIPVKGWYYLNWYAKKVVMRIIEIGLEVYGGMAPQKELPFEHYVRVLLSVMHGGSTGLLNLIKASRMFD
jgi:alkylation response protein AidB-like acyl-CoA dehydrogenase